MNADLGGSTVTIQRADLIFDPRYGSEYRDWDNAISVVVRGCNVQPFKATEVLMDREYIDTHLRLFAPAGTSLEATDRVLYDGEVFEVDGQPARWYDDAGILDHIAANLKRKTG